MMVATVVLMIYASLAASQVSSEKEEEVRTVYPACVFNSLCTCSKGVPDLGHVICENIPLSRIPRQINNSRVHFLQMQNNGLRHIEPNFLEGTGLYRISISKNNLTEINAEAFTGLERTLWDLDLHSNHLTTVPSRAIRHLLKLRTLNLTDNEITDVAPDSWRGVEDSLVTLVLRDNAITSLQPDVFSALQALEVLDLSGNALLELSPNTFHDGPPRLSRLYLHDNSIQTFPYLQLSALRNLHHLDLSYNRISQLHILGEEGQSTRVSLSLDTLRLDYNQIQYLPTKAFENFRVINSTYLDGNPISIIQVDAFQGLKTKKLHLKDCGISELAPGAFSGLELSLTHLDLSGNNLTQLPLRLFNEFDFLETLSLRGNLIVGVNPSETFNGFKYSINHLDMSGPENSMIAIQDLKRMRNLKTLILSRLPSDSLQPEDFQEFGMDLRNLKISNGNLKGVKSHAFRNAQSLEQLDLSENMITAIDNDAFSKVGDSLTYLNLASAFASSMSKLPNDAFRTLTALIRLDISNNKIKTLPESSFHFMRKLRTLHMQDNLIDTIYKGTFQTGIHDYLEKIILSYNQLTTIGTHTFVTLPKLTTLRLNDNRITRIEKRAFRDLERLKYLDLRGNRINYISEEGFQQLVGLQHLDLAYNELRNFDFSCLEEVGLFSSLRLNISHNNIKQLESNNSIYVSDRSRGAVTQSNVQALDFSHNNITSIGRGYFRPVERSLTNLDMSHNSLSNISRNLLGEMRELRWLDLGHNSLKQIDFDSFSNIVNLQVMYFGHNELMELPGDLFRNLDKLRVVDLSYNRFRALPEMLFRKIGLENLYLAGNHLTKIPVNCFSSDAAQSLVELDLSDNAISALHPPDAYSRFLALQRLDLSRNRLIRLDDGVFSQLPSLFVLDLSHNLELTLDTKGMTFQGIEDTLEELYLRNLSMSVMPEMRLPSLRLLDMSDNHMSMIPPDLPQNLSSLRTLRVSNNHLESVPPSLLQFSQLHTLEFARNPIANIILPAGLRLQHMDMRHLPLDTLEVGTLGKMPSLRSLRVSPSNFLREMNLPHLLQDNFCLHHLHIEMDNSEAVPLDQLLSGALPPKVRELEISGKGVKNLGSTLLQGIRQPTVTLRVYNTSIDSIPKSVFTHGRYIRSLRLDVRFNSLRSVGNPNTAFQPGFPRKMFLTDLKMEGNNWNCDCELGWIEGWERKRRQYFCTESWDSCLVTDDDLREAQCENKKKSILEVLKADVECGWNSGSTLFSLKVPILIGSLVLLLTKSV